jgi:hypothetical protein
MRHGARRTLKGRCRYGEAGNKTGNPDHRERGAGARGLARASLARLRHIVLNVTSIEQGGTSSSSAATRDATNGPPKLPQPPPERYARGVATEGRDPIGRRSET